MTVNDVDAEIRAGHDKFAIVVRTILAMTRRVDFMHRHP